MQHKKNTKKKQTKTKKYKIGISGVGERNEKTQDRLESK